MNESIGIALSGGGFRASAFHLGVLKRLEELGILHRIERLSTVSGGSITGALYALQCARHGDGTPGTFPVDALIADMKPFLTSGFRRRALTKTWRGKAATFAAYCGLGSRVSKVSSALDEDLFHGAMLCETPPWLLINATNVLTGKAWRFFHDRAGDYLIGATDKTDSILLADAVTASAAFPGFVESLPFKTRWQDLRGDLLDSRWQKPERDGTGAFSRWRSEYGSVSGDLIVPLTDGGLYDNEGIEGLRSSNVNYVIFSSTAPPDSAAVSRWRLMKAKRLVDILHARLGAVTRKLAHETTHGTHPNEARRRLLEIAESLCDEGNQEMADELRGIAKVGWPPRGPQFRAYAPIIMNRQDLARNTYSTFDPPVVIEARHRGLTPRLVDALARVRTDLDAFDPYLINLLIAQAYFLTDAHIRIAMPELRPTSEPVFWEWAVKCVHDANANEEATLARLKSEATVHLLQGR